MKAKHPQLLYESKLYRVLQVGSNARSVSSLDHKFQIFFVVMMLAYIFFYCAAGISNVEWFGVEGD